MTEPQLNLVEALARTGKPVVLVLVEGRPRVIRTIVDDAKAILMAYLPGLEGGQAVADVLFGDVNPSGKLPLTYPKFAGGFMWYDHKNSETQGGNKYDPQWPFGFGLSYSKIVYHGLRLDASEMWPTGHADRHGRSHERQRPAGQGDRPALPLRPGRLGDAAGQGAQAVPEGGRLQPKDTQTVRFTLGWDDLAFIGRDNKPVVEPGEFKVQVGDMSVSFTAVEGKK